MKNYGRLLKDKCYFKSVFIVNAQRNIVYPEIDKVSRRKFLLVLFIGSDWCLLLIKGELIDTVEVYYFKVE